MTHPPLKPIRNENDYQAALHALGQFFDSCPDESSEETQDYFDILATLVERYESQHHAIEPPTAIAAIQFRMEQMGLEVKDLENIIGKPNRVYEIFNGKRPLSLPMIRRLHTQLGISADVLIQA